MSDLTALAERIERAAGPSSDLDMEIWCAAVASAKQLELIEVGRDAHGDDEARFRTDRFMDGRRYTFSLNAALTLIDQRAMWAVINMEDGPIARLCWPQPNGGFVGGYFESRAATPELAVCAASLRARDSDASLAEDPKGLSREAVAARAEGIAQTQSPTTEPNPNEGMQVAERLRETLTDIEQMATYRIQDGIEMGANVWKIALQDIASDARDALTSASNLSLIGPK